jgi:hypothetical protein
MDRDGNKEVCHDIAAAKVKVPLTVKKVVDVAIQAHLRSIARRRTSSGNLAASTTNGR